MVTQIYYLCVWEYKWIKDFFWLKGEHTDVVKYAFYPGLNFWLRNNRFFSGTEGGQVL